jgi:hypothetical protein
LARRRATYEDLRQVPEHLLAEIIDGEPFAAVDLDRRRRCAGSSDLGVPA